MTGNTRGYGGGWELPLPALLDEAKNATLDELHQALAEEGFDGLRFRHGCVFRFIDAEGSRVTDLAAQSGLTKQAIGEVVAELERLGYVERASAPDDRRAKIIRLTEQGTAGQQTAARILDAIEERWSTEYGHQHVATMRRILREIASA